MRIDYTSARVATSACYLHYKKWNDHGFNSIALTNMGTVTGTFNAAGYQPVARGWYEWGDDTSFMINNGTITANGTVDSGDPYVHGMFLWAGNASRIENNEILSATASTDAGQATAYGACLQGHEVTNTGTISVNASSDDDRATAYGVRFFSFDANGVFNNSGSITARAESDDGWAYGLLSTDADRVENTGNMTAIGNGYAIAILTEGPTETFNQGRRSGLDQQRKQHHGQGVWRRRQSRRHIKLGIGNHLQHRDHHICSLKLRWYGLWNQSLLSRHDQQYRYNQRDSIKCHRYLSQGRRADHQYRKHYRDDYHGAGLRRGSH
jgi:hypothetical protein